MVSDHHITLALLIMMLTKEKRMTMIQSCGFYAHHLVCVMQFSKMDGETVVHREDVQGNYVFKKVTSLALQGSALARD